MESLVNNFFSGLKMDLTEQDLVHQQEFFKKQIKDKLVNPNEVRRASIQMAKCMVAKE